MSVRPLPLKSPVTTFTPGAVAQPANPGAGELWMVQVPSPLAKAAGTVLQPGPPTRAMSVRPLPKLPVTTFTPGAVAQPANPGAGELWMVQVPSPLANAAGTVVQPWPPTRAMSVRPLPLNPPVTRFAPCCPAQMANPGAGELWTVQVPSPLANAAGTVVQPWPPTRAMSSVPLLLNPPVTPFAPGCVAQMANPGAGELWMVQVPSPLANAVGIVVQPW